MDCDLVLWPDPYAFPFFIPLILRNSNIEIGKEEIQRGCKSTFRW